MKTLASGLLTSQTLCYCLRVERTDGVIDAFTSADHDLVIDGLTYRQAVGLDISNLVSQGTLAVDNLEIGVFPDETAYPQVDILAGRWDKAEFRLFECDYTNPAMGENLLKRGTTGQADTLRGSNRFEFRGIKQGLQQPLGAVTSKTCRYRLGSTAMPDGLCFVDLAPWTHTLLVTAVASRNEFTASAAVQADDYFGEGTVTFNDGENAGFSGVVKSFSGGVFDLKLDMPFEVTVGDEFVAVAGCRKRLEQDCLGKFDNVLNFGGEPHLPGIDAITKDPEIAA